VRPAHSRIPAASESLCLADAYAVPVKHCPCAACRAASEANSFAPLPSLADPSGILCASDAQLDSAAPPPSISRA
jgi:hypothetical protein